MAPKLKIPTAADCAVTAVRMMHAMRVREWYPGGIRTWFHSDGTPDGYPPPSYLFSDLEIDCRAIAAWPDRQAFGWIVVPTATFIVRAIATGLETVGSPNPRGDHFGSMVAHTYRGEPVAFYTWDGRGLDGVSDGETFDRRVKELGSAFAAAEQARAVRERAA